MLVEQNGGVHRHARHCRHRHFTFASIAFMLDSMLDCGQSCRKELRLTVRRRSLT
jgi:hypothetical protein